MQMELVIRDDIVEISSLKRLTKYRLVRIHRGSICTDPMFLVQLREEEEEGTCGHDIYTFIPAKCVHVFPENTIAAINTTNGLYYVMVIWTISGNPDAIVLAFWGP
jgi:hypothetical protein